MEGDGIMRNWARLGAVLAVVALVVGSAGVAIAGGESEVQEKALPSGALRFVAVPPCRLADLFLAEVERRLGVRGRTFFENALFAKRWSEDLLRPPVEPSAQ